MARCMLCRKSLFRCECHSSTMTTKKAKVTITDKNGKERTVTRNIPVKTDGRGFDWCMTCNCRVINDQCTNVTCSTRR